MIISQKAELAALVCHIGGYSKSGIPIRLGITMSQTWLAGKREEEENRQLQSVVRFTLRQ